jgi:hypothetical protein
MKISDQELSRRERWTKLERHAYDDSGWWSSTITRSTTIWMTFWQVLLT